MLQPKALWEAVRQAAGNTGVLRGSKGNRDHQTDKSGLLSDYMSATLQPQVASAFCWPGSRFLACIFQIHPLPVEQLHRHQSKSQACFFKEPDVSDFICKKVSYKWLHKRLLIQEPLTAKLTQNQSHAHLPPPCPPPKKALILPMRWLLFNCW